MKVDIKNGYIMKTLVKNYGSLALLVPLFLVFLLHVADSLPVPDGLVELEGSHKSCVNPEECCKFGLFSKEFADCCQRKECCLIDCHEHQKGINNDVVDEYCDEAWECCRFRPQTQEFNQCCSAHGCCPRCSQVSRGCCYNGLRYDWGSIAEGFPDMCLNLVCAAKVALTPPFFTAVIVPVKLHYCTGSWCEDCLDYHCVDETGLVRAQGSTWFPDECRECRCSNSTLTCQKLEVHCPPRPYSHCVEIPGLCCPEWDCPKGCIDEDGQHRELGSSWFSHPCIFHICEEEGIVTRIQDCFLDDPIHPSCEVYTPEGECCPHWHCSGCVDKAGNYREPGHDWSSGDPCITYRCTDGQIKETHVQCTKTPAPHPGCYEYTPVGDCCPKWNCSRCVDYTGTYHPLYDEWKSDPCTTHFCTEKGTRTRRVECHLGPAPHTDCLKYTPKGRCCPEWQCSGCFDNYGKYYELGHEWSAVDPCKVFYCTKAGIKTRKVHCEKTHPPHAGCYKYTPVGECCPKWNCSGCVDYSNTHHPVHDVWKTDPCTTHVCKENGIHTSREECHLGPAPHHSCDKVVLPGKCCPRWKCSGCFDDYGHYHELGDKWSTSDPCKFFVCTKGKIQVEPVICGETKPLHSGCFEYTPVGECCKKWNCSGCIAPDGAFHPLHDVWTTDPCTSHECTRTGIVTTRKDCYPEPAPHPSCEEYIPPGGCCSKWRCSGCFDDYGNYYKLGREWNTNDPCILHVCTKGGINQKHVLCEETNRPHTGCYEYTPDGECCPKWNCSGCVHAGTYHRLHDVWRSDPCTTHKCTKTGVETSHKECRPGPAPHHSCHKFTPPGECCSQWKCSGCFDDYGTYYELGHEWSTSDPCIFFVCTEGGIDRKPVDCEETLKPHSGCYIYTPKGECCPKWNCSGCVDDAGTYHPLYHVWKSEPCISLVCTRTGIQKSHEDCYLGPAPHHTCEKVTPPGECCPEWKCSGCFDKKDVYHELGSEWYSDDPCVILVCKKEGITMKHVKCEETSPPYPTCIEYSTVGECCPKWNCSGCVDTSGQYHQLYSKWKSGPCISHECRPTGIRTILVKCIDQPHPNCEELPPQTGDCCAKWKCGPDCRTVRCSGPPAEDCIPYKLPLACCNTWNCSGCFDEAGDYYPLGKKWQLDLCTKLVCTEAGINVTHEVCTHYPPPHKNCVEYTPEGECCPRWNCSVHIESLSSVDLEVCVDKDGGKHKIGKKWLDPYDSCFQYECTKLGHLQRYNVCD
ncbi:kielin/chordin-like protein [Panulirus ornatus]|uniref:kielin/chordin-like protein n=1 Tax=Panulirus ornatus TaxID=150431 RepID=UPI003A84787C